MSQFFENVKHPSTDNLEFTIVPHDLPLPWSLFHREMVVASSQTVDQRRHHHTNLRKLRQIRLLAPADPSFIAGEKPLMIEHRMSAFDLKWKGKRFAQSLESQQKEYAKVPKGCFQSSVCWRRPRYGLKEAPLVPLQSREGR